jgi:heme-degrading monooxygenase HmoA
LDRYVQLFALFESFRGYVDFFLLQDAVEDNYLSVRFWAPFDDFTTSAAPQSLEAYLTYRNLMFEFLRGRNSRISSQTG